MHNLQSVRDCIKDIKKLLLHIKRHLVFNIYINFKGIETQGPANHQARWYVTILTIHEMEKKAGLSWNGWGALGDDRTHEALWEDTI